MSQVNQIIVKPLLTEKTSVTTEKDNRYGFVVDLKANKDQIRKAVESLFDVKVVGVRTSVLPGRMKRAGKFVKKTTKTKKAYVQIAKGQKIEFFKEI
ncbi:MAG: 50S ribosomal protein L23 [Bacteriovoracaceae bacterium]|nr:50S ribosomal protein L23 [Bacteriovoracaceae bacterium]